MESTIQTALLSDYASVYLAFVIFATGILTSFTPCVYPILPITISVVKQHATNFQQSTLYTLLYVLGLALVYSLLGYFAASAGHLFGSIATHPYILVAAGTMCILMAAWMMGWVAIPQRHIPSVTWFKSPRLNVFIAGALSGLVMAPCTSPVLGMLLMFVATEQAPLLGALYLFIFALGMSALLIVCGVFSNLLNRMPKSGPWLNAVKYLLCGVLLVVAFSFYSQITC